MRYAFVEGTMEAEFAGDAAPRLEYPGRGHVLRNFALLSAAGKQVQISVPRPRQPGAGAGRSARQ